MHESVPNIRDVLLQRSRIEDFEFCSRKFSGGRIPYSGFVWPVLCVAHYSTCSLPVLGGRDSVSGLVLPLPCVVHHSICSSSNMAPYRQPELVHIPSGCLVILQLCPPSIDLDRKFLEPVHIVGVFVFLHVIHYFLSLSCVSPYCPSCIDLHHTAHIYRILVSDFLHAFRIF